jgi:hypothetical protein
MLCNGVCHLGNDTFLAVQQDVAQSAFFITSSVSQPVLEHGLNRACFFGVCPTSVPSEGGAERKPFRSQQHALVCSPDGLRVVALSFTTNRHYLLEPLSREVTEFTSPHGKCVLSGSWIPTVPHLFIMLLSSGVMVVLDLSSSSVGASVTVTAERDLKSIVVDNMTFKEQSRINDLAQERILCQHTPTAADLRKPSPILTQFVHFTLVPAANGLPTMMLLLTREGMVYAIKLNDLGVPAEPPPDVESEGPPRQLRHLCVHQLFAPAPDVSADGLAVGYHCLDSHTGYSAVFIVYSDGVVRGKYVQEGDMLSRDKTSSGFQFGVRFGPSVARQLEESPADAQLLLPAQLPQHDSDGCLLQIGSCGNVFVVRYDSSAYLLCFPEWSVEEKSWVARRTQDQGNSLLPVLSNLEFPTPVVLRLPYSTIDYSIAVGNEDIVLFPRRRAMGLPAVVESVTALIRCAIYCELTSAALTVETGEDVAGTFGQLYAALSATHRAALRVHEPGGTPREADPAARLLSLLSRAEKSIAAEEERLDARQAAIRARFRTLSLEHQNLTDTIERLEDRVANAQLHREGVESLVALNKVLERIQDTLDRVENSTAVSNEN